MRDFEVIYTDVLVVGAGGAGCRAAIAAADEGASVLLIDKGRLGITGSTFDPFTWGKGIIAAVKDYNPTDDPEVHYREAMQASRGLADPKLVQVVAEEAPLRFRELLEMGLKLTPCQWGTCFGNSMVGAVVEQPALGKAFRHEVSRRPIQLIENTMVVSLLIREERCFGALGLLRNGQPIIILSRSTVLATGGGSAIFGYNLNSSLLSGDGYIMALDAGAKIANFEFYQAILGITEPIKVYFPQWFLAGNPEIYNRNGRRFLKDYLPEGVNLDALMMERSLHGPFSSNKVTRWFDIALDTENQAGRGSAPWNDLKRLAGQFCAFSALDPAIQRKLDNREALPALEWFRQRGLRLDTQPVPIAPCAHAFNGGIVIDEHGQTGVEGLYACGEATSGPHGANRLGGHMFAVLLVFGARTGTHAARTALEHDLPSEYLEQARQAVEFLYAVKSTELGMAPHAMRRNIQSIMNPVLICKNQASLQQTLDKLKHIGEELSTLRLDSAHDKLEALSANNLWQVASLVVNSALLRSESRGPHYRTDFPEEDTTHFNHRLIWRRKGTDFQYEWG